MQTEIVNINQIPPSSEILIYGTGAAGHALFHKLRNEREDIIVHGFIDSFKDGEVVCSKPVVNVRNVRDGFGDKLIVVASVFAKEIIQSLLENGISNYCLYNEYSVGKNYYEELVSLSQSIASGKITFSETIHDISDGRKSLLIVNAPVMTNLEDFLSRFSHLLPPHHVGCEKVDASVVDISSVVSNIKDKNPEKINVIDWCGDQYYLCSLIAQLDQCVDKSISVVKIPCKFKSAVVVDDLKIIYLPIKKSASSSTIALLRSLFEVGYELEKSPHAMQTASSLLQAIDITDKKYNEYHFFTVVRYPYLRLASLYASCMKKMNYILPSMKKKYGYLSFDKFAEFVAVYRDAIAEGHFASQVDFLKMPDHSIKKCRIIKLENYDEELSAFLSSFGVKCEPMHMNKTRKNVHDYIADYYDSYAIGLINERYQEDFHAFGYPFL